MLINNIEMKILIKGRPISEYAHNGQRFVEGRDRSKFEIELVNRNGFSVEAIVSVDGLSVIDGKEAGPASSGWMLKANETLRIPGWKLDNAAVAAFEFSVSGKGGTYAEQTTGRSPNSGVIGVMAYKEKVHPHYNGYTTLVGLNQPYNGPYFRQVSSGGWGGSSIQNGFAMPTATVMCASPTLSTGSIRNAETFGASAMQTADWAGALASVCSDSIGMSPVVSTKEVDLSLSVDSSAAIATQTQVMAAQVNNLGTAFGERTEFASTEVTFERGDLLALGVIFYDDARGLKARGIVLERRQRQPKATPNAFPGLNTGCTPPRGWKG